MHNAIKIIILYPQNNIPAGYCFDSHFIIKLLMEKYSDEYLQFVCQYVGAGKVDIAKIAHSQIAFQIKELTKGDDPILKQHECKIVSYNIHHKISANTLWERIL